MNRLQAQNLKLLKTPLPPPVGFPDKRERAPRQGSSDTIKGGLLGESERKNVYQMARDAVEVTYHKLHHFLTEATRGGKQDQ